jgi:hypothetical protein
MILAVASALFGVRSADGAEEADRPISADKTLECQLQFDVVTPRVPDKLSRVTLDHQELGGELDRRIRNLIYQNDMVVGEAAPGAEQTLKVKLHYWRDGVVKHLEFPQDSALDLS